MPESRKARYIEKYGFTEKEANFITASKYLSNLSLITAQLYTSG